MIEIAISPTVNGIEKIESQTLNGTALIRIYLYPDTNVASARTQVTSVSQAILHLIPPHIYPPTILLYTPSSVPIIQMVLTSEKTRPFFIFSPECRKKSYTTMPTS